MDCKYRDKSGSLYIVRFIIQGPHYYTLVAHGKSETPAMDNFLNSFEIKSFIYDQARVQKDTSLYFTVNTPFFPENKKIKLGISKSSGYSRIDDDEEDASEDDLLQGGAYRNRTITNDTTGEKIYISFYRSPRYFYTPDTSDLDKYNELSLLDDNSWIFKYRKKWEGPDKLKIWEAIVTDTGSSRTLWTKSFYRDGIGFSLITESDTLSAPSPFVKGFYETFSPTSLLKGINPFAKKSDLFFSDFMSKDSVLHKRAVRHIDEIDLDSTDLPLLRKAIAKTDWTEKKYLETKKALIRKLGDMPSNASANYLKQLYYSFDDTVQLQYTVLESLLQHQTNYAFNAFREIINTEVPVLVSNSGDYAALVSRRLNRVNNTNGSFDNGSFLDELTDSLQLTRTILPDLLPLLNLDDYKNSMMRLLGLMVDSNLVTPTDYESYFNRFLMEARQELKKQSIAEKKKAIEKAEESKEERKPFSLYGRDDDKDYGNDGLGLYATLLLPSWQTNPAVQPLLQQMLKSNDKYLKYQTMFLFLRHGKSFPDSLLNYFGGLDEFRYQLYTDLKEIKKTNLFPSAYNNQLDLGKSYLLDKKSSGKPDSLIFVDKVQAEFKGKKGFIYFYKYKSKKDDLSWKLATVGLMPEDPRKFEYEEDGRAYPSRFESQVRASRFKRYDFTGFTDTKLQNEEAVAKQLNKALKKIMYSRHKSAREFYDDSNDRGGNDFSME